MGAGRLALFKVEFALRLVSWHSVRPAGPLASGSLAIGSSASTSGLWPVKSQIRPCQHLPVACGPGPGPVLAGAATWRLAPGGPPRLALETRLPGQGRWRLLEGAVPAQAGGCACDFAARTGGPGSARRAVLRPRTRMSEQRRALSEGVRRNAPEDECGTLRGRLSASDSGCLTPPLKHGKPLLPVLA